MEFPLCLRDSRKKTINFDNLLSSEADLGLLQNPRWSAYHKALHLGCCSSPRSASDREQMFFEQSKHEDVRCKKQPLEVFCKGRFS